MPEEPGAVATLPEVATPPAFGEDAPTEPPAETQPAEPEEAAAPPRTWQSVYEEVSASDDLKAGYDSHLDEVREVSRKEGHAQAQKRLQPLVQQFRDSATMAAVGLKATADALKDAISEGTLDERAVTKLLQEHGPAWSAWNGLGHTQGTYDGAKVFLQMADDKIGPEYAARIDDILRGTATAEVVVADFIDDVVAERVQKAKKPLEAEIARLKAAIEQGKTDGRAGQGPPQGERASGGKLYSRMTREERMVLTPEQRDALAAQEMRQ